MSIQMFPYSKFIQISCTHPSNVNKLVLQFIYYNILIQWMKGIKMHIAPILNMNCWYQQKIFAKKRVRTVWRVGAVYQLYCRGTSRDVASLQSSQSIRQDQILPSLTHSCLQQAIVWQLYYLIYLIRKLQIARSCHHQGANGQSEAFKFNGSCLTEQRCQG